MEMNKIIEINECRLELGISEGEKVIFELPQFSAEKGEKIALVGPSGCGKSTLINLLAGLLQPSSGSIFVKGTMLSSLSARKMDTFRGSNMGIIYQKLNLLQGFTAFENILIGMRFGKTVAKKERNSKARELLNRVGLEKRINSRVEKLSGGELQRVAVARAIANDPSILLADEPTGSLDPKTAESIFDLIRAICIENECTLLFITHDHKLADRMGNTFDCRELIKHISAQY